jgi:hypothetical protein
VHIGIACLAAAWGAKITSDPKPKSSPQSKPVELGGDLLADVEAPVAGGDTMAASRAILAKLQAAHGG